MGSVRAVGSEFTNGVVVAATWVGVDVGQMTGSQKSIILARDVRG
jgi:hypothetical protein